MSEAMVHRGSGGFSRRFRLWISAISQWSWSRVSIASAEALCSRLPHSSTAPRLPRNIRTARAASAISGDLRKIPTSPDADASGISSSLTGS